MSVDQTRNQNTVPPLVAKKLEPETKIPSQGSAIVKENREVGSVIASETKETEQPTKKQSKPSLTPPPIRDKPLAKTTQQPSQATSTKRSTSRSRSRDRNRGRKERQGGHDGKSNKNQRDRERDRYSDRNSEKERSKRCVKSVKRRQYNSRTEEQNKNITYFKTKMCPAFLNGRCVKENRCTFAHGTQQLRQMPNFKKTKLCNEYMRGQCPFSSRECKYAHGEVQLKKHTMNQQHRAEYQAEMKKYQVNSYDYAPMPPTYYGGMGMPPTAYPHSGSRGNSSYGSSGYPGPSHPPSGNPYPPIGPTHPTAHVRISLRQIPPHRYDNAPYINPSPSIPPPPPSGNWSSFSSSGPWLPPPSRPEPIPFTGPLSTSFTGYDPVPSPASLPYRHFQYGTPGNNVNVMSRGGQASIRDVAPSSNFGSGGLPSTFSSGSSFAASGSGPFSSSPASNLYSGGTGPYNPPSNPPNPSAGTSGTSFHYLTGSSNFDPFQMNLNDTMPRRMPLPPSDR